LLTTRRGNSPFEFSAKDIINAGSHSEGWDVRALRREWESWCKSEGITPEKPLAHFISFIKEHVRRNGKGR